MQPQMSEPVPARDPGTPPGGDPVPAAPRGEADDLFLVRRAQRGEMGAYDELIQRYQERIYRTVYNMVFNHEDANDLAQEAFIRAYRALGGFQGQSSFYTWIHRIAVNKTLTFLKSRKGKFQMSLNDLDANVENDAEMVELVSEATPQRDVALAELQEKMNEALAKLSENHRLVVTLHDVQGMTDREIAQIMDCTLGTVRSRLFYARQKLQSSLSRYLKS
jgi:RNA polymerase sigma-70 factor (ECF subfamily)